MTGTVRTMAILTAIVAIVGAGALARAWIGGGCQNYEVVYDGYGKVSCSGDAVTLHPAAATRAEDTHAALVVTPWATTPGDGARVVRATTLTEEQVRDGAPNPWEAGWLLWNYNDPARFYALVLKPNGWEVSKQDAAYPGAQRFLASGTDRVFPIGTPYEVEVTLTSTGGAVTMEVSVDGEFLASVTDTESPYTSGSLALYCEDALVTFSDMSVAAPEP